MLAMAFFMPLRLGAVAGLAMAGLALTSLTEAQAVPTPGSPATTGAGAATRPAMTPSAPIAPKPSAPRAGGNAGNLSTSLVKAPAAQSLKAKSDVTAAAAASNKDALPPDPTLTMAGSRLGQF
jgi:hypothetical protein